MAGGVFSWWYQEGLKDIKGISLNHQAPWAKNVYWMVCSELDGYTENQRDEFIQKLKSKNIDSRPSFLSSVRHAYV